MHKILKGYLVKNTGILLIANVIVLIIGFAINIILARNLSKESFGLIKYVFSIVPFVAILSLPGINSSVFQYVAKGYEYSLIDGVKKRLKWSMASAVVMLLFALGLWFHNKNQILIWLILISLIFFPFTQVFPIIANFWAAKKQFLQLAFWKIGEKLTGIIGAVLGIWLFSKYKELAVVGFQNLFLAALSSVCLFLIIKGIMKSYPKSILTTDTRRSFYSFGKHMTAIGAIGTIQNRFGSILIGSFLPFSSLADYSIGLLFYEQQKQLWLTYTQVSYPRLVNLDIMQRRSQLIREAKLVMTLFVLIVIGIGAILTFLTPKLFSNQYLSSIPYIWLLLIAFVSLVPGGFAEIYFRTKEQKKELYIIRIIGAVAGIIFPVIFLLHWQALGVALGKIFANLMYSITGVYLFFKDPS